MEEEGRAIPPAVYAWYNRGLYHERRAQTDSAINAFTEAIDLDRKSGSAWASLGRVECQLYPKRAMKTFSEGLKASSRKAPIYIAQGRCYLSPAGGEDANRALKSGLLAIGVEAHNAAATMLVIDCYQSLGQKKEALRFEQSHRIFLGEPFSKAEAPRRQQMDSALKESNLDQARSLALGNTTPGELAIRAFAWGSKEIAKQQAKLVSAAAPKDGNAALTLILLGEPASGAREEVYSSLCPLASLLFSIHIKRSLGADAASYFNSQYSSDWLRSSDPLVQRTLKISYSNFSIENRSEE